VRLAVALAALLLAGCQTTKVVEPPTSPKADAPTATRTPTLRGPVDCPPEGLDAVADAKAMPDLTLNCLGSDDARNLATLAGRPMLINFWASWCGPCKIELPLLAQAHHEWGDRVAFLGIDAQDASAEGWKALTAAGVEYPQLEDPKGRSRAAFGWTGGLPLTVFVDARGRIVGTERTAFRTYPEVTAALRRHLGSFDNAQEQGRRGKP